MGRRSVRSSDPRAPGIGFLCTVYVTFLGPLLGTLHFLCNQIFGGRGDGVAATEPDLRGRTADRKRIK